MDPSPIVCTAPPAPCSALKAAVGPTLQTTPATKPSAAPHWKPRSLTRRGFRKQRTTGSTPPRCDIEGESAALQTPRAFAVSPGRRTSVGLVATRACETSRASAPRRRSPRGRMPLPRPTLGGLRPRWPAIANAPRPPLRPVPETRRRAGDRLEGPSHPRRLWATSRWRSEDESGHWLRDASRLHCLRRSAAQAKHVGRPRRQFGHIAAADAANAERGVKDAFFAIRNHHLRAATRPGRGDTFLDQHEVGDVAPPARKRGTLVEGFSQRRGLGGLGIIEQPGVSLMRSVGAPRS
eukprot:scaffold47_cov258-Pinguiococcus_pyrenoidosus.AAC.128